MCCDLMSIEDLCNESPQVENTSDINEEDTLVPPKNCIELVSFWWPISTCVYEFSVALK
jgi:hypothetical protein